MTLEWVIPPVVGAVIGYSTNWLAIKMLFKPYKKIKIKGIPIPFTPGVIPKERKRIASKLGEVVQGYLLTEDVIIEELLSESVKSRIITAVTHAISNPTEPLQEEGFADQLNQTFGRTAQQLILSHKTSIIDSITQSIVNYSKKMSMKELVHSFHDELDILFKQIIENHHFETYLQEQLNHAVNDEKTLGDLLDEDLINEIYRIIQMHIPRAMEAVKGLLSQEAVREKAEEIIADTIKEKVGALGAMFVNPASIYETAVDKINHMLEEDETKQAIERTIYQGIQSLRDKRIADIVEEQDRQLLMELGINKLLSALSKCSVAKSLEAVIQEDKKLYDVISQRDNGTEWIRSFVENMLEDWIQRKGSVEQLSLFIKQALTNIGELKPILSHLYTYFIKTQVKSLIKDVKIGVVVEKQINTFDIKQLEDILLAVIQKEFTAITWFGALLGFLMGLISLAV